MIHPASVKIHSDPMAMLWHYANGEMPCYLVREGGEVGWIKYTHRGVQFLDKFQFPRKQLRYIFSPKFTVKYNQAFEETLAGGAIGVQIGGYITCETMFHRVSNASKAVWGQTLVRLKERGFKWIDTNCVAAHHVEYGEEWMMQWKFEQMVREAMQESHSLADNIPCPPPPWVIKAGLPVARMISAVLKRLPWCKSRQQGVVRPNPAAQSQGSIEPSAEPVTAALQ